MIWNSQSSFMLADVCSESCMTAHGRSGAQNATHWRSPCQLIAPMSRIDGGVCLSGEEGAKAGDEEMIVAAKNAADQEAAVPQEEAAPAAPAS